MRAGPQLVDSTSADEQLRRRARSERELRAEVGIVLGVMIRGLLPKAPQKSPGATSKSLLGAGGRAPDALEQHEPP